MGCLYIHTFSIYAKQHSTKELMLAYSHSRAVFVPCNHPSQLNREHEEINNLAFQTVAFLNRSGGTTCKGQDILSLLMQEVAL